MGAEIHAPVLNHRLGQATKMVAQQANRFSNSTLLVDQYTGTINQTFTGVGFANAVDITNSSAKFALSRVARILCWAQCDFANNAGNTDYIYLYMDIDGSLVGKGIFIGTAFEAVCESMYAAPILLAGVHTIKVRGYVGAAANTGICYDLEVFAFLVGS